MASTGRGTGGHAVSRSRGCLRSTENIDVYSNVSSDEDGDEYVVIDDIADDTSINPIVPRHDISDYRRETSCSRGRTRKNSESSKNPVGPRYEINCYRRERSSSRCRKRKNAESSNNSVSPLYEINGHRREPSSYRGRKRKSSYCTGASERKHRRSSNDGLGRRERGKIGKRGGKLCGDHRDSSRREARCFNTQTQEEMRLTRKSIYESVSRFVEKQSLDFQAKDVVNVKPSDEFYSTPSFLGKLPAQRPANLIEDRIVQDILQSKYMEMTLKQISSLLSEYEQRRLTPEYARKFLESDKHSRFYFSSKEHHGSVSVSLKTNLRICDEYMKNSKTSTDCSDCNDLHICKFYLIGQCNSSNCMFSHNHESEHNVAVLKHHGLALVNFSDVVRIARKPQSRNSTTLPLICKFYQNYSGCRIGNTCKYLHICKFYIQSACTQRGGCMRSHDVFRQQSRDLLREYGLCEHNRSVLVDVLKRVAENSTVLNTTQKDMKKLNHSAASSSPVPEANNNAKARYYKQEGQSKRLNKQSSDYEGNSTAVGSNSWENIEADLPKNKTKSKNLKIKREKPKAEREKTPREILKRLCSEFSKRASGVNTQCFTEDKRNIVISELEEGELLPDECSESDDDQSEFQYAPSIRKNTRDTFSPPFKLHIPNTTIPITKSGFLGFGLHGSDDGRAKPVLNESKPSQSHLSNDSTHGDINTDVKRTYPAINTQEVSSRARDSSMNTKKTNIPHEQDKEYMSEITPSNTDATEIHQAETETKQSAEDRTEENANENITEQKKESIPKLNEEKALEKKMHDETSPCSEIAFNKGSNLNRPLPPWTPFAKKLALPAAPDFIPLLPSQECENKTDEGLCPQHSSRKQFQ